MADMNDGFHSAARPQESLQGGAYEAHTQQPQTSEAMTNPRSAAPDNVGQTWNTTSLKPLDAPNASNKKGND